MEYQPLSEPAQLQVLEGLAHLLLHGVLLAILTATVVLLYLYLSELRLPQRRPSEVEDLGWRKNSGPRLAARSRASLDQLTPIRLWAEDAEGRPGTGPGPRCGPPAVAGDCWGPGPGVDAKSGGRLPAIPTPALWRDACERGHRRSEPADVC